MQPPDLIDAERHVLEVLASHDHVMRVMRDRLGKRTTFESKTGHKPPPDASALPIPFDHRYREDIPIGIGLENAVFRTDGIDSPVSEYRIRDRDDDICFHVRVCVHIRAALDPEISGMDCAEFHRIEDLCRIHWLWSGITGQGSAYKYPIDHEPLEIAQHHEVRLPPDADRSDQVIDPVMPCSVDRADRYRIDRRDAEIDRGSHKHIHISPDQVPRVPVIGYKEEIAEIDPVINEPRYELVETLRSRTFPQHHSHPHPRLFDRFLVCQGLVIARYAGTEVPSEIASSHAGAVSVRPLPENQRLLDHVKFFRIGIEHARKVHHLTKPDHVIVVQQTRYGGSVHYCA